MSHPPDVEVLPENDSHLPGPARRSGLYAHLTDEASVRAARARRYQAGSDRRRA